ncbi:MAG: L-histidine N(alpha)-methyltransferase, partial [Bacteroidales bacterium]|nr:L-histidine N(alpha)-methyltransferase [Bacteroidales bacterium]
YYPTRTEKKIISTIGDKLAIDFSNLTIIELGSGDPSKISLLLSQIPKNKLSTISYYPVDISLSAIENSAKQLAEKFPLINIHGIAADFIHQLNLLPKTDKRLFCFFGSTIGNFGTKKITEFMTVLGSEMQIGDSLLLGMDMIKDINVLENAYNDSKQITADFNKNILNVLNDLMGSDFNIADFEHIAFFNKEKRRIEMHLKAKKEMFITFNSNIESIFIKKGELIHTENSHKFDKSSIKNFGLSAGLHTEGVFTDANNWFSLLHYKKYK